MRSAMGAFGLENVDENRAKFALDKNCSNILLSF